MFTKTIVVDEATEAEMFNYVMAFIEEKKLGRLETVNTVSVKFIAVGNGWCEFDLPMLDGSWEYFAAWIDRDSREITIEDRRIINNG
jgi:hypothetical protein